ncbi:hypothetical protein [Hoeflea alexandrii]
MWDWEWAAQFGSFVGGVAAGGGFFGLYFVYRQWRDARAADQKEQEHRQQQEIDREAEKRQLALAKLADEISLSTDMLLIERSKLWAQALNRFPADTVARSVLAAAAIRTTLSTTNRIESALVLAKTKGFGDELLRSIQISLDVLQAVGKEDMSLVSHLQDYDLRFSKLRSENQQKLAKQPLTEAEHEMLAFHSMDGLIQTSNVFLALGEIVTDLGKKVDSLREEIERQKSAKSK